MQTEDLSLRDDIKWRASSEESPLNSHAQVSSYLFFPCPFFSS